MLAAVSKKDVLFSIFCGLVVNSKLRFLLAYQPAITCSKLTIETLEQGVKYVQI